MIPIHIQNRLMAQASPYMQTQADPKNRDRVIVHHLDGSWRDEEKFPAMDYSRFKYGCGDVAKQFGEQLADAFIKTGFLSAFDGDGDDIVITASPYKYIQPAASAVKKYFTNRLNAYLATVKMSSANMVKMTRSVLFEGDYGRLTEEGRTALLKKDKLSIDRDFVDGKTILVLDDIKITGAHEEKIVKMFIEQGIKPKKVIFLYYAELQNANTVGADYENYLNHFLVKSLDDLLPITQERSFILNARVCKYLLSTKDLQGLERFLRDAGDDFVYDLVAAILGDGYHVMESYQENFHRIKRHWNKVHGIEGEKNYFTL